MNEYIKTETDSQVYILKKQNKTDWWLPVGRGRVEEWELQISIYKMDRLHDAL